MGVLAHWVFLAVPFSLFIIYKEQRGEIERNKDADTIVQDTQKRGRKNSNFEVNLQKPCSECVVRYILFYKIKPISTCRCVVMV